MYVWQENQNVRIAAYARFQRYALAAQQRHDALEGIETPAEAAQPVFQQVYTLFSALFARLHLHYLASCSFEQSMEFDCTSLANVNEATMPSM